MNNMNNEKKISLKIEDLEERIAPHLDITPALQSGLGTFSVGNSGGIHGDVGPGAPFIRPHH